MRSKENCQMLFFNVTKMSNFIESGFGRNSLFPRPCGEQLIDSSHIDYKFFIELRRACKFLEVADISGNEKDSIMGPRIPYRRGGFPFETDKGRKTLLDFCNKVLHSLSIGGFYDGINRTRDDLFLVCDDGYSYSYEESNIVKEIHIFFDGLKEKFGLVLFSYLKKIFEEKGRLLTKEASRKEIARGLDFGESDILGGLRYALHRETQKDFSLKREVFGYLERNADNFRQYNFFCDPENYQFSSMVGRGVHTVEIDLSLAHNSRPDIKLRSFIILNHTQIIALIDHILSFLNDSSGDQRGDKDEQ